MRNDNYQKAKGYLQKCGLQADFAHDAYVLWFEKTGKNIFNEPNGTVIRVIKNLMFNAHQKKRFMWRGQNYAKVYVDIDLPAAQTTEQVVDIELYRQMLPITYREIFDMLIKGYLGTEIAEERGVSPETIYYYRNQIRKILSS